MIIVKKDDKVVTFIACPPIDKGCDIINFDCKINNGYTYNFDGLILITTPDDRKLYYKGDLIASTKRHVRAR
jgi:hypothetical protein